MRRTAVVRRTASDVRAAAATFAMTELKERLQAIYDEAKQKEMCDNGGGEHGGSQARCRGDMGEIWARYGRDIGEI